MKSIVNKISVKFFIIAIFVFYYSLSLCSIVDDQKLSIGNTSNPTTLKAIPNSYFILGSNKIKTSDSGSIYNICVLDAKNKQFLGHMNYPYLSSDFDFLPSDNGWNAYMIFEDNMTFGKIDIDTKGFIRSHEKLLPWQDADHSPLFFGCQEKNELFIFGNKIYKYIPGSTEFEIFDLPTDWPTGVAINQYNFLEGTNKVLLFGKDTGCIWDLDSNTGQMLPEIYYLNSIKPWINHPGKYICLAGGILTSFDPETFHFDVLFKELPLVTKDLAIDDTGTIFYSYIKDSNSLIVIDLDKNTYQLTSMNIDSTLQRIFTDNWFLIPGEEKILTNIATKDSPDSWFDTYDTALIDLNTKDYKILKSEDNSLITQTLLKKTDYIFYSDLDIVIADNFQGSLGLFDADNETLNQILQFGFSDGFVDNQPLFVRDRIWLKNIPYVINCNPSIGKSDIHYVDPDYMYNVIDWCMYPDETGFIFGIIDPINGGYTLWNYMLSDGSLRAFDLPNVDFRYRFFMDLKNNIVIAVNYDLNSYFYQMQYIKGFNNYRTWTFPYSNSQISNYTFDETEGAIWLSYSKQTEAGLGFMKITDWNQPYEDHFYPDLTVKYGSISLYNHGEFLLTLVYMENFRYLYILDPKDDKVLFKTQLTGQNVPHYLVNDASIVSVPEKNSIYLWDGDMAWKIDTQSWTVVYGNPIENINYNTSGEIVGAYDHNKDELVFFDTAKTNSIVIVDPDTGTVKKSITISQGFFMSETFKNPIFDLDKRSIYFLREYDGVIAVVRLDEDWDNAPTIKPQGQFVEYRPGDTFKLILDITNPADVPQDVTVYIWFWLPTGQYVFFGPNGLTTDIKGIPLTLPANLDTSVSLDLFTVPEGMPAGFYNLNAVFFNNATSVRGPMGTYNFMAQGSKRIIL
jgi:hypothetical protein